MAHIRADRIQETTTGTGTGALTLAGAVSKFRAFSAVLADTDSCVCLIEHNSAAEWEVSLCTYASGGNTLTRSTVYTSSNGGSLVNFSAGTKTISLVATSSKQIVEDPNGDAVVTRDLAVGRNLAVVGTLNVTGAAAFGSTLTAANTTVTQASPVLRLIDSGTNQQGGVNVNNTIVNTIFVGSYTINDVDVGSSNAGRIRIKSTGEVHFHSVGTTASAANAFLDSGSTPANQLLRSTSSLVYKRDVENLDNALADAVVEGARPVWYRSKAEHDRADWGWYGLIAEELAEIDPRLVTWGYQDHHWESVERTVEEEYDAVLEGGGVEKRTREVAVIERHLKVGAEKVPDGVAYERLSVILLNVVRRQRATLASLAERVAALESA